MGLLTTALIVGAGSAAMGAVNARKERKRAEADMRRNQTLARENARLDQTKEETGADIVLGTDGAADTAKTKRKATPRKPNTAPPTVGTTVGGGGGIFSGTSLGTALGFK